MATTASRLAVTTSNQRSIRSGRVILCLAGCFGGAEDVWLFSTGAGASFSGSAGRSSTGGIGQSGENTGRSSQAAFVRPCRDLNAVGEAEFGQDVPDVRFGCFGRDDQLIGNATIAETTHHQAHYFAFAFAERI